MRSARARLAAMLAASLALIVLLIVVLVTPDGGRSNSAKSEFEGSLRPPAAPVDFGSLRDQHGHAVGGGLGGHVAVVTFVYSTCEDPCPLTVEQIASGLARLPQVPVLAVSLDPAADTPAHVRRFLAGRRSLRALRYLTGTRAQLAPVWRAFGIVPGQDVALRDLVLTVLIDRSGRQRVGYAPDALTPEALAHDIGLLEHGGG